MKNPFTEHPHKVNETYFEHMKVTWAYTFCFFWLACKSLVHGIFPWIFNGCISKKVCDISDHIKGRIK